MTAIRTAAPFANLRGTLDRSRTAPVYDPEQIPSHCPMFYIFAEKGPTLPQLVSGAGFEQMYGIKSLDARGKFATHQLPFVKLMNANANAMYVQRVIDPAAVDAATWALYVDMVKDQIKQYERGTDGRFKLDTNQQKIPTGETVEGWIVRLAWGEHVKGDLGAASQTTGKLVSSTGEQSTMFPIWEISVSDPGAYGKNLGIRLSAPNINSQPAGLDEATVLSNKAYLYRLAAVERPNAASSAVVQEGAKGQRYLDFSFKDGVISAEDQAFFIGDSLVETWREVEDSGVLRKQGPFGAQHIYEDNLKEVLTRLFESEQPFGLLGEDEDADENYHLVNFLTATDQYLTPYFSVELRGPLQDGLLFDASSTHYAVGGDDGKTDSKTFNELVREQAQNFGELEADLYDTAIYDMSVFYDSGFDMETKNALLSIIGKRYDVAVIVATQDVDRPINAPEADSSAAMALSTRASNYPESVLFGTPACRAAVVAGAGKLKNQSVYRGLLPFTYEVANMCSKFMGAANGFWADEYSMDEYPNNVMSSFKDTNIVFRRAGARDEDWRNNMIYAQNFDRRSAHFPAFQTVYQDDSSVLNSLVTMFAIVEVEKICQRVWRRLTGISKLTAEQFAERSDRLINAELKDRFGTRFLFNAVTSFTPDDTQRGWSWSTQVDVGANGQMTVGSYTIVARRRADMEASQTGA